MDNTIVHALNWILPLGILPDHEEPITLIEDEDGPKGMMQWLFTDRWKPVLENEALGLKIDNVNGRFYRTSVVLPGCLMVENWPEEHVVQYEWYVPITDDMYEYWEVLVRVCKTDEETKAFKHRFDRVYLPLCLHGFNDCDLYAREAMEEFYADGYRLGCRAAGCHRCLADHLAQGRLALEPWHSPARQGRAQRDEDLQHPHAADRRGQGARLFRPEDRRC
jgi:hypothetical protein